MDEPKCWCTIDDLLTKGCKCGKIDYEREQQRKEKERIISKKRKALNKGVSYEERCKQYGDTREF